MAKLIHFQAGIRITHQSDTGRLARMPLWESKSAQYSLETWPDAESAERAFRAGDLKWRRMAAEGGDSILTPLVSGLFSCILGDILFRGRGVV
jgi:hypothetical protein